MDGGLIYRSFYKGWVNEVGMRWPYWDEFEVGCTIETAGYAVSWLTAYFGPVESITAFATCRIPDLQTDVNLEVIPPQLTVACLKFKAGPIARLTTSYIAPPDHSLRIFGAMLASSAPTMSRHRGLPFTSRATGAFESAPKQSRSHGGNGTR